MVLPNKFVLGRNTCWNIPADGTAASLSTLKMFKLHWTPKYNLPTLAPGNFYATLEGVKLLVKELSLETQRSFLLGLGEYV